MAISNKNVPLLHRKEFQMMSPAPVTAGAGAFVIAPDSGNFGIAMLVSSATGQFLYNHDEDGWAQIPSGALGGTFGAGACGVFHPWSIPYTANGGSVSSVTVAAASFNISGRVVGSIIEFLSAGASSGFRSTITGILTNAGTGTITINFSPSAPAVIANAHTFRVLTGKFYVLNAGTVAAGIFKVFDLATMAWQTSLATTNLPATIGTDGKLVLAYNFGEILASGTASSGAATTLTNSAKNWANNQWANAQVRITGGTGIGQVRTIASNNGTVLTVSAAWTTNPDATSTYEITANEDYLYFLGNNAVTMYRYSISGNAWTVLSPGTARGAAPGTGMTAGVVGVSGDALWANESAILDGRFLYSFRASGGSVLDRYDIAGNAWQVVTHVTGEVFTTGSSAFIMGEFIYIRRDNTHRYFKYSVVDNCLNPLTTNMYPDSTAGVGSKIWVKKLTGSDVLWLYSLMNNGPTLHRLMLY